MSIEDLIDAELLGVPKPEPAKPRQLTKAEERSIFRNAARIAPGHEMARRLAGEDAVLPAEYCVASYLVEHTEVDPKTGAKATTLVPEATLKLAENPPAGYAGWETVGRDEFGRAIIRILIRKGKQVLRYVPSEADRLAAGDKEVLKIPAAVKAKEAK